MICAKYIKNRSKISDIRICAPDSRPYERNRLLVILRLLKRTYGEVLMLCMKTQNKEGGFQ